MIIVIVVYIMLFVINFIRIYAVYAHVYVTSF